MRKTKEYISDVQQKIIELHKCELHNTKMGHWAQNQASAIAIPVL